LKGSMRENGFRAIGGLAQRLASDLARHGKGRGSVARLRADWPAIVGPELARVSRPDALLAGRSRTAKALRLRVSGAAALELQHMSGLVIERVNGYFGHKFIEEVRLVQGTIAQPPIPRAPPAPDPAIAKRMAGRVAAVKDPELRAALARLGARVTTSRRGVVLGAFGAMVLGDAPRAQSADRLMDPQPGDHVLGKAGAPNVVIDYFSLTCPHCANFHAAVLPQLRREWIDPGRMRFVYRHFPSDSVATRASQLAECAGPERFFANIDVLFRSQVEWLTATDPEGELVKLMERAGLANARACFANDRLFDKVVADVQSGQMLGVRATPTLFINGQNYGMPADGAAGINAILRQVGR